MKQRFVAHYTDIQEAAQLLRFAPKSENPRQFCVYICGFNIAILAAILLRGSRPIVGPRWSAWVAIGGVAIYTILVGAEPAVVRAAVMAGIFIFAGRVMGRPSFATALSNEIMP